MSEKLLSRVLVFDVDGVINDPLEHKINNEVMNTIVDDLSSGVPVAFNTGRAIGTIEQIVNQEIIPRCGRVALEHLLLIAEKGCIVAKFDQDGKLHQEFDQIMLIPDSVREKLHNIALDPEIGYGAKFHKDKQVMATFSRTPEGGLQALHKVQSAIKQMSERVLKASGLGSDFVIDTTNLATDIYHRLAGKRRGAQHVLKWLSSRGEVADSFYSFGDSPSDEEMAEVFAGAGFKSTFIYVGNASLPKLPSSATWVREVFMDAFDQGTAEYLRKL